VATRSGAQSRPIYQPSVALAFFKVGGRPEALAQGATLFAENEKGRFLKRSKMYLLLEGEVSLLAKRRVIGTVRKGEIFGELAAISNAPRSAPAVARTPCRVIALDESQFEKALARRPEFALMLMGMMVLRLRETIGRLVAADALTEAASLKESSAIDPRLLPQLVEGLTQDSALHFDRGKAILREGQAGLRMYVVLSGRVAVSIGGTVVERLGAGGVFGEMALLEQSTRAASVAAETDCSVIPIAREGFLALVKLSPAFASGLLRALAARLRFLTAKLA
jgi:CRP-like cAMP-binding protein